MDKALTPAGCNAEDMTSSCFGGANGDMLTSEDVSKVNGKHALSALVMGTRVTTRAPRAVAEEKFLTDLRDKVSLSGLTRLKQRSGELLEIREDSRRYPGLLVARVKWDDRSHSARGGARDPDTGSGTMLSKQHIVEEVPLYAIKPESPPKTSIFM